MSSSFLFHKGSDGNRTEQLISLRSALRMTTSGGGR